MIDRIALEAILQQKVKLESVMATAGSFKELAEGSVVEVAERCPKCGKQAIVCCYADLAGPSALDYYDNFAHVCVNPHCDHSDHFEERVMVGQESSGDRTCPFCRRKIK